jgi:hypothetical protein
MGWLFIFLILTLFIGFRHEVGEDWKSYLRHFDTVEFMTLEEVLKLSDPGYFFLNWLAAIFGGGVYTVNTLCGLLFSFGLISFVKQLPRPSLAMAVASPYLILVVAMGYSRQGVAIGISMLGLTFLQRDYFWKFLFSIVAASLFHKSAMLLVMLALITRKKQNVLITSVFVFGLGIGLFFLFLLDSIDLLQANYLEYQLESDGAIVRVALNALPAAIFLFFRKRFQITPNQSRLWTAISILALFFIWILWASPSSTAVDRMALYLIPLQLFVWSHFPDALGMPGKRNLSYVIIVLFIYAFVLFVWLNFATHSQSWVPYKFYPLQFF